jgi:hypothetical protein
LFNPLLFEEVRGEQSEASQDLFRIFPLLTEEGWPKAGVVGTNTDPSAFGTSPNLGEEKLTGFEEIYFSPRKGGDLFR